MLGLREKILDFVHLIILQLRKMSVSNFPKKNISFASKGQFPSNVNTFQSGRPPDVVQGSGKCPAEYGALLCAPYFVVPRTIRWTGLVVGSR